MTKLELHEYVKSARDTIYFLNNYGYIYDVTKKQIDRLNCFSYQEDMVNKFNRYQNNIVLKSRQLGLSVITAGYVVWTLLFKIDQRILIVANDGAAAVRFLSTVKQFMDNLPKFFYDPDKDVEKNNEKFFALKNGNWVKAVASGKQAGRGEALTMLILDEVAFIENADDIWMGAGIALTATKGKCIMVSTPYGTGNLYHRTWVGSQKNENSFVGTTIHWTEHPVYSIGKELRKDEFGRSYWWSPWYEGECERFNFDRIKIAQELDLSFEGSRAMVIDSSILMKYEQELLTKSNPICYYDYTVPGSGFVNDVKTNFWVWEMPNPAGNYIVTADVGRGDGSDFSTIQIIDANELKQVAEYQGKIPPDLFAHMIYKVALEYNRAYVVIEANSFGLATCLVLKNQLKYDANRIYHSKSVKKMVNHHWNINVDENAEVPGFQTTMTTRPLIIASLIAYMREGKIGIRSKRVLEEFKTFIYSNDHKAQHAPGYHDDLIIALAIALYIRDTEFANVFISRDFYKSMLEAFSHTTTDNKYNRPPDVSGIQNSNHQNLDDDLSWLLR